MNVFVPVLCRVPDGHDHFSVASPHAGAAGRHLRQSRWPAAGRAGQPPIGRRSDRPRGPFSVAPLPRPPRDAGNWAKVPAVRTWRAGRSHPPNGGHAARQGRLAAASPARGGAVPAARRPARRPPAESSVARATSLRRRRPDLPRPKGRRNRCRRWPPSCCPAHPAAATAPRSPAGAIPVPRHPAARAVPADPPRPRLRPQRLIAVRNEAAGVVRTAVRRTYRRSRMAAGAIRPAAAPALALAEHDAGAAAVAVARRAAALVTAPAVPRERR